MNQMIEPSMYERPERPEWPLNALPKHWIEALFAKMSAFYGSRFAAMWSGSKPEEVQKAWAIELAKLSREQLKAGSDALTAFAKPPTLPEFVAHCKSTRAEQAAATAPKLADEKRADQATVDANLGHIRAASARLITKEPTAEWAFQLVLRGKSAGGSTLPFQVASCATDAITSTAGRRVVDNCPDPELKRQYAEIRQTIVDDYRMRGKPLWDVR
ncbi:hypothetical protein [Burkholderia ambifaria]|uniref:hypothetical protein n=1 Tax=Burkholderia ambifaria TaxID=152480 RepID=UPI00158C888F|nr:hypothetical protein [Burkholderia ambifaria]